MMENSGVILIADDNENNLRVLSTMLRSSDYNVRIAKNGLQVLSSVAISKPDLILLDIHMPEMDGYQTCIKLKENLDYKDIPVIFISALTETFNKVHAFNIGAVDYITKPFQVEEVKLRIQTHLLLRKRTQELENALGEIKRVQTKLIFSEKMASLGILSAGIAHEINNPINFVYAGINSLIKNFNELEKGLHELNLLFQTLEENKKDAFLKIFEKYNLEKRIKTIPQLADDIKTGAVRTTDIVKGLRLFARSDMEEKVVSDVSESVEAALLLLKNQYKNRIDVIKNFTEDLPSIKCYPGQLTQAFVNIIHNAIDAIEGKGTISISLEKFEDHLKITIADTGKGMSHKLISRIFDPFFTTKSVGGGMGLGLAITHGIIEKHNGTIQVRSVEDEGTTFEIMLPI
jgi:two-component system, NtrC family, sensor kinase